MNGVSTIRDDGSWKALDVIGPDGKLKAMPAQYWLDMPTHTRKLWAYHKAQYSIPTLELIEYLKSIIIPEETIEIGAGNGWLGSLLGIKMTDSYLQTNPEIKAYYKAMGQPTISYGHDVVKMDALTAVSHFKPKTVIGSWITQLHKPGQDEDQGNRWGVDEEKMLTLVDRYIFIGCDGQHGQKEIFKIPHKTIRLPSLVSRAIDHNTNAIWIWEK